MTNVEYSYLVARITTSISCSMKVCQRHQYRCWSISRSSYLGLWGNICIYT